MKSNVLTCLLAICTAASTLVVCPALAAQGGDPIDQWSALRYGMFIHFGMSTFTARECDPGDRPSATYAPTALDVDQWIRVAKQSGMKYAVLTSKHVAGHCLWDSKVTWHGKPFDYDVATSGNKTDVVAEFVKACKKYGLMPGLYWCMLDYHNNSVAQQRQWNAGKLPADFYKLAQDQLTELIANYPDVGYYWLDIPRAASAEQRRTLYDLIKRLRPGTIVLFNHGAGRPTGPMTIARCQAAWPTDVFNTERFPLRPGWFTPRQQWQGATYHLGYEHCDCLGKDWFWTAKDRPRPTAELYKLYRDVRFCGGNLLLDVPPDRSGRIPEASVQALAALKQCIDAEAGDSVKKQQKIRVEEQRLPGGDSQLRLVDQQGKVQHTVKVDLSHHHHPAATAEDPIMRTWRSWQYGAFVCYNSNQFSGQEYCVLRDPNGYAPSQLDVKQWVRTIKAAGMQYAVLTASHTSGFLLWDSPTSEFDVANSGDKTDVVGTFVDQCRREQIVPGIYYCLWGGPQFPKRSRGEARTDSPRAVILYQLHELATRYGPIPYFWIDMMNWAPTDLTAQEIYDVLKNANPKAVVILNQQIQDGRTIKYFPTDVLNGEATMPPKTGHQPVRKVAGATYYLPFEYEPCSQWRPGQKSPLGANYVWFTYGEGKSFQASRTYSAKKLLADIAEARRRGTSNVLLACAPDHTGRFREADAKELVELGRMLRGEGQKTAKAAPTPSPRQAAWQKLEVIGMVNFSTITYYGKEWGYGDEDPKSFNPTQFDARQIVRAAKSGGLKGLVIDAKHHGGFCLWPSKFTDYSVKNSPWKNGRGDMVGELAKACRDEGLLVGIYLSPWDRHHKDYGKPAYVEYYHNQLRELLSQYGPLFEVWFDGANGGDGWYGGARCKRKIGADYYQWGKIMQIVHKLQPQAVAFNCDDARWVGNEKGIAGDPCWATINAVHGSRAILGHGQRDGKLWIPAEADFPLRPGWFWHPGDRPKSAADLVDRYFSSVGRNCVMDVGIAPDRSGLICDEDAAALKGFGDRIRAIFASNLAARAKTDGRTLDFGRPTKFSVISLRENIRQGERVDDWALDAWTNGVWKEFARGVGIGNRRLWRGSPITSTKIRLRIGKSSAIPDIAEFAVYLEPEDK